MDVFDEVLNLYKKNDGIDIREYSPLVLAYIGDAVYEVYVRTHLITSGKKNVYKLHKESIAFVKASSQKEILGRIMGILTDSEKEIVRRGRNANSGSIPKNANVNDYRYATGFEALIGYLYLDNEIIRLNQIMNAVIKGEMDEEKKSR